ncbi:MAG: adenylyl-sulfate kinase [Gammaproteobacteria bacterium]|nr:adenylyl-sulfate kinase [Gammaproteobacteria bacterium]
MVIWLMGLSGSGKTTLGRCIYSKLKETAPETVFIDGDEIREIFAHDKSADAYSVEGRRVNNERIAQLCAWLDRQHINVVCCILNIFPERLIWNRETYSEYFDVCLSVPLDILETRDIKNLYRPALNGECQNVVGVDIPFNLPEDTDLLIDNSQDNVDMDKLAIDVLRKAGVTI